MSVLAVLIGRALACVCVAGFPCAVDKLVDWPVIGRARVFVCMRVRAPVFVHVWLIAVVW